MNIQPYTLKELSEFDSEARSLHDNRIKANISRLLITARLMSTDADRWKTAKRLWNMQKKRPPELGFDRGNDCYDTIDEAIDANRK